MIVLNKYLSIFLYSNAIGPVIAIYLIYQDGSVMQEDESPFWIMLYGGFGISVGLWMWGQKVIKTIGSDLTTITPSRYTYSQILYLKKMQCLFSPINWNTFIIFNFLIK